MRWSSRPTSAPGWSEVEWAVARVGGRNAGNLGVARESNCAGVGRRLGRRSSSSRREQCLLRDALIGELLQRLDAATRGAGIGCVALKGSRPSLARHLPPGERPMGDIDLLVRQADCRRRARTMARLGYRGTLFPRHASASCTSRIAKLPPKRVRRARPRIPSRSKCITSIAEPLPARKVDITARLQPTQPRSGLNRIPASRGAAAALAATCCQQHARARLTSDTDPRPRNIDSTPRRSRLGRAARRESRRRRRTMVDVPSARAHGALLHVRRAAGGAARASRRLPAHPAGIERERDTDRRLLVELAYRSIPRHGVVENTSRRSALCSQPLATEPESPSGARRGDGASTAPRRPALVSAFSR